MPDSAPIFIALSELYLGNNYLDFLACLSGLRDTVDNSLIVADPA